MKAALGRFLAVLAAVTVLAVPAAARDHDGWHHHHGWDKHHGYGYVYDWHPHHWHHHHWYHGYYGYPAYDYGYPGYGYGYPSCGYDGYACPPVPLMTAPWG